MVRIERTIYDDLICNGCNGSKYYIKKLSSETSGLFSFEAWCTTCEKRLSLTTRADVKLTTSYTELVNQSDFLKFIDHDAGNTYMYTGNLEQSAT